MPTPSWGLLASLRPAALDALRAAAPVAFVPWGALEWHGVHAPVGLDGHVAEGYCAALAAEVGGVVLPPLFVGADTLGDHHPFPYCISHPEATVRALCTELLAGLAAQGWRLLVVVTGHAGQGHQDALRAACDAFAAAHPDVAVRMWTAFDLVRDTFPDNHAARGETSVQLCLRPDTVDLSAIPEGSPAPTLEGEGVWGEDPRGATAEEGAATRALFVARAAAELRPLLAATRR